jgi:hypothetical protein
MKAAISPHSPRSRHAHWLRSLMLTALVAGAGVLSSGQAQARDDVYWSIGVQSPGVAVGVSNAPPPPVVVHPAYPVYTPHTAYPAYPVYQPRPVYQRPIVVQPAPVVVHPYPYGHVRPVVVERPWRGHGPRWDDHGHGRHKGGHKGGHEHHRHGDDGRRGDHGGWHEHRH